MGQFGFLDLFYKEDTFLLVDPIMGDNGERYPIFTSGMEAAMRELALRADIITPNLTELCLLAGADRRLINETKERKKLVALAEQMARDMTADGIKEVIVTGIRFRDESWFRAR